MNKLEEKKERLAAKIADLKARLEKLEARMAETEEAILDVERKKKEEQRKMVADTVEKILGEIPLEDAAEFEEFLEVFRESYAPAGKAFETTDNTPNAKDIISDSSQADEEETETGISASTSDNPAEEMEKSDSCSVSEGDQG